MSNKYNDVYADLVMGYINDNEGTVGGKLLQYYWDKKDHDGIELTLAQIRKADFDREYSPVLKAYKESYPHSPIDTTFNLDGVPF